MASESPAQSSGRLACMLGEIYDSGIPVGEQRRLGRFLVGTAWQGRARSPRQLGADAILHLEEALAVVGHVGQFQSKPSITAAKAWLRTMGKPGEDIASRIGRLSRIRNTASHPDTALIEDIRRLGGAPVHASSLAVSPDSGEPAEEPITAAAAASGAPSSVGDASGEDPKEFLVDNSVFRAQTNGLGYRRSRSMVDKDSSGAATWATWGTIVKGVDTGDGWLKVGSSFLPMALGGTSVLTLVSRKTPGLGG